jgi:hypothetical protein
MTEEQVVEVMDEESIPDATEERDDNSITIGIHKGGRSLRMDTLTWAFILIWAGAVMLMNNVGYLSRVLERLNLRLVDVSWPLPVSDEVWTVFFMGLGIILLVGVILRLLVPQFRHDVLGNTILVIVAFSVAFGRADIIWPLILIALGVSIVIRKAS